MLAGSILQVALHECSVASFSTSGYALMPGRSSSSRVSAAACNCSIGKLRQAVNQDAEPSWTIDLDKLPLIFGDFSRSDNNAAE